MFSTVNGCPRGRHIDECRGEYGQDKHQVTTGADEGTCVQTPAVHDANDWKKRLVDTWVKCSKKAIDKAVDQRRSGYVHVQSKRTPPL